MLEMLSEKYRVDVAWLMGYDVPRYGGLPATVIPFGPNDEDPARMVTTEEEYDLLKAYRGAEETARRYALEMLRAHQLNP